MPNAQNKEKPERGGSAAAKVKKRKTVVQRSHTFSSSYENCTKRKPKSDDVGQEKKSTPSGSPCPEPKYTKAVYLLLEAKKLAREIEEKKEKGELFRNRLRGTGVATNGLTGVKGKALEDVTRRCEECGRNINKGSYSENLQKRRCLMLGSALFKDFAPEFLTDLESYCKHEGHPYCNVPCYSMLFSSLKSLVKDTVDGVGMHPGGLSHEQKVFRNSLIPKLRTYNTYYVDRPFQISCTECKSEFMLEGTLRVYWGLKNEVRLKADETKSYWKSFHPDDGITELHNAKSVNKRNSKVAARPASSSERKINRGAKGECSFQAPTISSYQKQANNNEHVICYKGVQNRTSETPSFVPPYGLPTTLRVTNKMNAVDVIGMLFKKFQIINKPTQYILCTVYESGGIKKINPNISPLLQRLYLGPCEDVSKIFIMETSEHQDIPHEIAQYCNFAMYELENFLQKYREEEEREIAKLKERYYLYKENLQKRMGELQRSSKVTRL